ncbi:NifB/NifX family molybdenum-iron cluster-binding protein [Roseospira goensis]|uniref:Putative Fe-Mo cluster-binding NifX family protein n=1 Tax=Roseospira goensis TaxID=391922 RepID=A0A7W6S2Y3_9PROT|nr:NifB/NifX family molybdenum-iron cluster-binding protein [Roseospira goensis]MBB4287217.1 putative Fe-Mo cluster-binding NifX family protein [Roseospira goensis]
MRIGFTSQNFRTITGHAGRTRRFLVYDLAADGSATEVERLDLPMEMCMHAFHGQGPHPLDTLDVLVTKECGPDFVTRMARRGVTVVVSAEDTDPASVLRGIAEGRVDVRAPAVVAPHTHDHDYDLDHGHDHGHCCSDGHGHGHGHGAGRGRGRARAV